MGPAFHLLCPRNSGILTPTAPTAIRLCEIFTFHLFGQRVYDSYRISVNICNETLFLYDYTVKILKIGTPEIITLIVLQLEQLDFTVQYCVQKMQTE